MALDERLRRELDRAAQPADPSGIYENLIRRRERRRIARKMQSGLLAVVVLAGSVGGFYALTRIFRETEEPPLVGDPAVSNGVIVFSLPLEDGGEHLFAVAADGSGLRRLTPEGRAVYRSPDVSPDGRTVVVLHEIPSFESGQSILATVPIEGGSPTWLTDEPQVVLDPVWSPDGRSIAFAGEIPGGPFGLYVLDADTGDAYLIPRTDNMLTGDPTWSPDGESLAFEGAAPDTADDGPGVTRDAWDIYTVRLDGSELTNLTQTPDESEVWPAWSWVTDRIAFVRGVPRGAGVYTMAPDGSDRTLVFDALPNLGSPVWSPDGGMIAFSGDTGQVYTVGLDGTDLRAVTGALGEPAWQAVPDDVVPAPRPTPAPSASPQPEVGEDIGIGFPVCNVSSVSGTFETDISGTAYVATRTGDTGCPRLGDGLQMVAVDVSGDGFADASYGPLECDDWCTAFAAPDVDGDGTDELLIQNVQFSIAGLRLYEIRTGPAEVLPVTVATPGYPEGGLDPGAEPQLWVGGDGFNLDELQCATTPSGRVLVQTSATMVPPDTPDSVWQAAETTFALNADGSVSVVETRTFEEPAEQGGPSFYDFDDGICGARLP